MLRNYFVLIAVGASLVVGSMTARGQDAGALLGETIPRLHDHRRWPKDCPTGRLRSNGVKQPTRLGQQQQRKPPASSRRAFCLKRE